MPPRMTGMHKNVDFMLGIVTTLPLLVEGKSSVDDHINFSGALRNSELNFIQASLERILARWETRGNCTTK